MLEDFHDSLISSRIRVLLLGGKSFCSSKNLGHFLEYDECCFIESDVNHDKKCFNSVFLDKIPCFVLWAANCPCPSATLEHIWVFILFHNLEMPLLENKVSEVASRSWI